MSIKLFKEMPHLATSVAFWFFLCAVAVEIHKDNEIVSTIYS